MARITCPECDGKSGHTSWGDGWSEWDECPCCNKDGNNDSGAVSRRRLKQFRKEQADDEAHWERLCDEYEREQQALEREYGPEHVW